MDRRILIAVIVVLILSGIGFYAYVKNSMPGTTPTPIPTPNLRVESHEPKLKEVSLIKQEGEWMIIGVPQATKTGGQTFTVFKEERAMLVPGYKVFILHDGQYRPGTLSEVKMPSLVFADLDFEAGNRVIYGIYASE